VTKVLAGPGLEYGAPKQGLCSKIAALTCHGLFLLIPRYPLVWVYLNWSTAISLKIYSFLFCQSYTSLQVFFKKMKSFKNLSIKIPYAYTEIEKKSLNVKKKSV